MTSSPKAIFFDIDGTLILGGKGPFQEDLEAMEKAARLGHLLFINTGRSFSNIPENLLELPFWNGVAAGGGAHVLLGETAPGKPAGMSGPQPRYKTIYHKWVEDELLNKICALYLERGKELILEGERECYVINPSDRCFTVRPAIQITRKDDLAEKYSGGLITKLTMRDNLSGEEQNLLAGFFTINRFADYAEAVIKGESKAKAIEVILDAVGIKLENSVALGDGVNDIDMLRFAGLGIAMGNAGDEVKAAAKAVTGNCGQGGAAQAIRRFVLDEKPTG